MESKQSETNSRYERHSDLFFAEFVSGRQEGVRSKVLEKLTNWAEVMETMLAILEEFTDNVEKAAEVLADRLQENLAQYHGHVTIRVDVKIEERIFNMARPGVEKYVKIGFSNRLRSEVVFVVTRKTKVVSLKELATEAVAELVSNNGEDGMDMDRLELPQSLVVDLKNCYRDNWTPRYWRSRLRWSIRRRGREEPVGGRGL